MEFFREFTYEFQRKSRVHELHFFCIIQSSFWYTKKSFSDKRCGLHEKQYYAKIGISTYFGIGVGGKVKTPTNTYHNTFCFCWCKMIAMGRVLVRKRMLWCYKPFVCTEVVKWKWFWKTKFYRNFGSPSNDAFRSGVTSKKYYRAGLILKDNGIVKPKNADCWWKLELSEIILTEISASNFFLN